MQLWILSFRGRLSYRGGGFRNNRGRGISNGNSGIDRNDRNQNQDNRHHANEAKEEIQLYAANLCTDIEGKISFVVDSAASNHLERLENKRKNKQKNNTTIDMIHRG